MFFGIEEIRKNVHGTFQRFYYRQIVMKTEKTKDLFNFGGDRFMCIKTCFARNLNDMNKLIEHWNNSSSDGTYKYELLHHNAIKLKPMDINEVIDEYNRIHSFGSVISHTIQENVEVLE